MVFESNFLNLKFFLTSLFKQKDYPLSIIKNIINNVLWKLYFPFGTDASSKQDVPKEVVFFRHNSYDT